jgi:hypothetical protein
MAVADPNQKVASSCIANSWRGSTNNRTLSIFHSYVCAKVQFRGVRRAVKVPTSLVCQLQS